MKPKKAVMLEYLDDYGQWGWYAVIDDATPQEALKWYADEHSIENPVIEETKDEWVLNTDEARAYRISITSIKTEND